MLSTSDELADRVCPSWNSSSNGINLFGVNRHGKTVGALLSDHRGGGAGARSFADGYDNAGKVTTHLGALSNVESQEWKLPILYLYRRQLVDSGGPGRFRGGRTSVAAITPHKTSRLIWKAQNTAGADQSNASGIHGGFPGAGSHVAVVRETGIGHRLAVSEVPTTLEALGGHVEHFPTKAEGILAEDDVLVFFPPGGGGFGDPLDRPVAEVVADVVTGAISEGAARRHYGVVLEGGSVDVGATETERARIRVARLGHEPTFDHWHSVSGALSTKRFGHCLEVVVTDIESIVRCGRCGLNLGPAGTSVPQAVAKRSVTLREAGPWIALRYGGDSPNFHLAESFCPGCGTLVDVSECRSA
jgi:N-methylhydantoinase B